MTEDTAVELISDTAAVIARQKLSSATSLVEYHSAGHCLVVGEPTASLAAVEQLGLSATVVTVTEGDPDDTRIDKQLTDTGVAVFSVPALHLQGHLGAFTAVVPAGTASNQEAYNLAVAVFLENGHFDLVLDLSAQPVMPALLPPFGYRHAADEKALQSALQELPTLIGEFEKPRYFHYDKTICAHSRSTLDGCNNCVSVCVTNAITSAGEGVDINPYLCQGCGSCATVCPSGAMRYNYPAPNEAIDRARAACVTGVTEVLVLHTDTHTEAVEAIAWPDNTLPLVVEEVSAFGLDFWCTLVAHGIQRIIVATDVREGNPNVRALQAQQQLCHQLLSGLGINQTVVELVSVDQLANANTTLTPDAALAQLAPASFATHNDKRQTIRLAMDALARQLSPVEAVKSLADNAAHEAGFGAPFGRIAVDQSACTLCMACVSTCPAKALLDGQDTPALRFIEANCLQCGLCETACPESAISLTPQYRYDSVTARQIDTLHEETPFHCVTCHKPFATSRMIDTLLGKLSGHWMYQDEKATRRLKMCEDCRVKDMFNDSSSGINVHRDNETS